MEKITIEFFREFTECRADGQAGRRLVHMEVLDEKLGENKMVMSINIYDGLL